MEPAVLLATAITVLYGLPPVLTAAATLVREMLVHRRGLAAGSLLAALVLPRGLPASGQLPPPPLRWQPPESRPPPHEPVAAAAPTIETYRVVAGDSLWAIASRILSRRGEPTDAAVDAYWRRIYEANRVVIGSDPDLIFPGQILEIPER